MKFHKVRVLISRALDYSLDKIFSFEEILFGRGIDYGMSFLAIFSVILVFLDFFGIKEIGIRIVEIDYAIFAVFFIEYVIRVIFAPSIFGYIKSYWYDIPGMLPLLLFEYLPPGPFGFIRFFRLFRLFILLRAELTRSFLQKYGKFLVEEISQKVMFRVLDLAQERINKEIEGRKFNELLKRTLKRSREDIEEILRRSSRNLPPPLSILIKTPLNSKLIHDISDRMIDLTARIAENVMERIEFKDFLLSSINRIFEDMKEEIKKKP